MLASSRPCFKEWESLSSQVKHKTKLTDSLPTLRLLDHAQKQSQMQTSLRNGPDRKGLLWLFRSFNWCLWWPKDCSDWSCTRNCNASKHCHWKILPSAYVYSEYQHKGNFRSFTFLESLITMISSVSNIMKQFKFSIHGLALLSSRSTCLSLTAGMYQCQLQLPSVKTGVRNFAMLPHFPLLLDSSLSTCHLTLWDDLCLHRLCSWLRDALKW